MNKRQFLRIAGGGVIAAATLSSLSGCSTHPSECRKSLCATTTRRYGIRLAHATLIVGFTGISWASKQLQSDSPAYRRSGSCWHSTNVDATRLCACIAGFTAQGAAGTYG